MNIGGINFTNDKGAILIGGNFSGKSRIIKKLEEASKKNKISVDGADFNFFYIHSETLLSETWDGTKSLLKINSNNVLGNVNSTSPQPSDLFNDEVLSSYEANLNSVSSTFNKDNIFGTQLSMHLPIFSTNKL